MSLRPLVLLTPSIAAAVELPRRLAAAGRAVALYRFPEPGRDHYRSGVLDFARAVAEPELLGKGLAAWDAGHDARLAAQLLDEDVVGGLRLPSDVPRGPVAAALARTLEDLRQATVPPEHLEALAERARDAAEDRERLRALARLYRAFEAKREGQVADPGTVLRAAATALDRAVWLQGAEVLIVEDLELDEREKEFLAAVAQRFQVRLLRRELPPSLAPSSFRTWARDHGIAEVEWEETVLAKLAPRQPPAVSLQRLRQRLFEPPQGSPARDDAVELVTAPGEASEVRALVRRLLREAGRGVPFEDMGVILPRADRYAPLFADLFDRLGVPFQLHPSLPLRSGRVARSLLLLFRCRGLLRGAVMEFLTFAPIRFASLIDAAANADPSRWDQISRDSRIVSGLDRWQAGLGAHSREEREAAGRETDKARAERRRRSADDADTCLRVVKELAKDLDHLGGEASWPEWSDRIRHVATRWFEPPGDNPDEWEAVLSVVDALGGLGRVEGRVRWAEVEAVVEERFDRRRIPLVRPKTGAVHVGALDAMAGLLFRVLAIPGLVEGGYPGVLRPDPFLLDAEREALAQATPAPAPRKKGPAQLTLFGPEEKALATTQDKLREARRLFSRALGQATERLILSYPRADPRSGRVRMPSLFFASAASALEGRPLSGTELHSLIVEDEPRDVDDALDAGERDRRRMLQDPKAAANAIASGSIFFRQSRWAVQDRLSNRLTAYDGFLGALNEEARRRLDPVASSISASRLATFSRCGFQYLLQYVLRIPPTLEPEERRKLEPLERGDLFHRVAERFLREMRDQGRLPVQDTEETRERLAEMAEEALTEHVAGSPPRFRALWDREKRRFHSTLGDWLGREVRNAGKSTPAHFEVAFGLPLAPDDEGEPHSAEPLEVDLGDGRRLRVQGKIDRIDRREDGSLVLRDYKTGKAPKDEGGLFRGGKQLQVPFYILAAEKLFPGSRVVDAFLDYVDGGRQVAVDPAHVRSERFQKMLRELVDLVGRGVFIQEPAVCDWCDYTAVCGPKGLLTARRRFKLGDPELQRALQAKDLG